jgi:hypothetical protein
VHKSGYRRQNIELKRLTGEGKDMVPERPPVILLGLGLKIESSLPQHQINSSQLDSIAFRIIVRLLSGRTGGTEWRCVGF